MKGIECPFIFYKQHNKNTAGNTQAKASYINKGVCLTAPQCTKSNFQVILEHTTRGLMSKVESVALMQNQDATTRLSDVVNGKKVVMNF
jgi:hypothetical protein